MSWAWKGRQEDTVAIRQAALALAQKAAELALPKASVLRPLIADEVQG